MTRWVFKESLAVSGKNVEFFLHTGVQVTVLTYDTFCLREFSIVAVDNTLTGADGERPDVEGCLEVKISSKQKTSKCSCICCKRC